jgi:hypothetical protein
LKGKCEKLLLDFFKIVYSVVGTSQLEQQVEALQKKLPFFLKLIMKKDFLITLILNHGLKAS